MLYSWIMSCEHRFIALNIVHKVFCQNRDEGWRRLFFTESLEETDLVEKFCDAAREELEDSDVVGNDLYEVLVIHHFACKYCYPVLRHEAATPPSGQKSTVQNIAIACQREFCMGREDLLNNLSAGFMTIPYVTSSLDYTRRTFTHLFVGLSLNIIVNFTATSIRIKWKKCS